MTRGDARSAGEQRTDRGFTLVELLIVIVLLGIVATVVVFAVRGVTDTAKQNVCSMDRRIIDAAVLAYDVATPSNVAPTERTLVAAGYLREFSPNFDLDATGEVVAQQGSPNGCDLLP